MSDLPRVEVTQWFVSIGTMGAIIPAETAEDAYAVMVARCKPKVRGVRWAASQATDMHQRYITEGVFKAAQCEEPTL